jgi:hypothetical protein
MGVIFLFIRSKIKTLSEDEDYEVKNTLASLLLDLFTPRFLYVFLELEGDVILPQLVYIVFNSIYLINFSRLEMQID